MKKDLNKTAAGRLAAALPVLHTLEKEGHQLERATTMAGKIPKEIMEMTTDAREGSLSDLVLVTLATRVHPKDRAAQLALYQGHVAALKALIDGEVDEENGSGPTFDAQDIVIFQGLVAFIAKLASRSQREVERFLDAIETRDNAVLVIEYQAHGERECTYEARFTPEITPETRTALKLRSPKHHPASKTVPSN